jgi:acyl-CoA synthetase (AMP-forming)/AMP-acid ligase II
METKIYTTLVDLLKIKAQTQPHQLAYTFLVDGEFKLDRQAGAIVTQLQSLAAVGERALLFYPARRAYIAAFFGCLYAGIVAVSTYSMKANAFGRC